MQKQLPAVSSEIRYGLPPRRHRSIVLYQKEKYGKNFRFIASILVSSSHEAFANENRWVFFCQGGGLSWGQSDLGTFILGTVEGYQLPEALPLPPVPLPAVHGAVRVAVFSQAVLLFVQHVPFVHLDRLLIVQ